MKKTCPVCKTLVEIDESRYEEGSKQTIECPCCGSEMDFYIPERVSSGVKTESREIKERLTPPPFISREEPVYSGIRKEEPIYEIRNESNAERAVNNAVKPDFTEKENNSPLPTVERRKSSSKGLLVAFLLSLGVIIILLVVIFSGDNDEKTALPEMEETYSTEVSETRNNAETESGIINENQENLIRTFYKRCVFGHPSDELIEKFCSKDMLRKMKRESRDFRSYNTSIFVAGISPDGVGVVTSVSNIGKNLYKVDYEEGSRGGSVKISLTEVYGEWLINRVEILDTYGDGESEMQADEATDIVAEEPAMEMNIPTGTVHYEGNVSSQYPVTARLKITRTSSGYRIKGKYAYHLTLNKYGDKPENWIYIDGEMTDDCRVSWSETTPSNADYLCYFRGEYDNDTNEIYGNIGSSLSNLDHTFRISPKN